MQNIFRNDFLGPLRRFFYRIRRRIERARYDADLAERRYEAVAPPNRLVARTLEQRWNDAAQRVFEVEAEFADFQRQTLRTITDEQKQQILQLASDFPRLWTAPTTETRDRKRMLRLLIKDITVAKGPERKQLRLQIRWQGGMTESSNFGCPQTVPMHCVIRWSSSTGFESLHASIATMRLLLCSIARVHELDAQTIHCQHDKLDPFQASDRGPPASKLARGTGSACMSCTTGLNA